MPLLLRERRARYRGAHEPEEGEVRASDRQAEEPGEKRAGALLIEFPAPATEPQSS